MGESLELSLGTWLSDGPEPPTRHCVGDKSGSAIHEADRIDFYSYTLIILIG